MVLSPGSSLGSDAPGVALTGMDTSRSVYKSSVGVSLELGLEASELGAEEGDAGGDLGAGEAVEEEGAGETVSAQ